jgi:hypothetical protein
MSVNIPTLTLHSQPVTIIHKGNKMRNAQSVKQYLHRTFTVSPIYAGRLCTGYATLAHLTDKHFSLCAVLFS